MGKVASDSPAFGTIDRIASTPVMLDAVREAHARPWARFWELNGAPQSLTIDIDATLITARSENEQAAGNNKHGYGFDPPDAWAEETREALAQIPAGLGSGRLPLPGDPCGSRS